MSGTLIRVVAGVMQGDQPSEVFVFRRAPGQRHAGHWEFPGGKLEAAESPRDGLVRELKEELDLDVSVSEFLWRGRDGDLEVSFYRVERGGKTPKLSVHDRFISISFSDPPELQWAPVDADFVIAIAKGLHKSTP